MIITKLQIKALHGLYDYDISFFNDLTFLFGENGCGKTTILNIISSIVDGRLYKLVEYEFEQLLLYFRTGNPTRDECVHITSANNTFEVVVESAELHEVIKDVRRIREIYDRDDDFSLERRFFSEYQVARYLRDVFCNVYLPLSRNSQDAFNIIDGIPSRRKYAVRYTERDLVNKNYLNDSLHEIEDIVRTGFMRISSAENNINAQFRKDLLASSLSINADYTIDMLFGNIDDQTTLSSIENNRREYIRILKSIGEWNEDMNSQVDRFFQRYREAFEKMQKSDEPGGRTFTINFMLLNLEFNRIKQIAAQAQEVEKAKESIRTPINAFLATVNKFFNLTGDKKHVDIDDDGRIVVTADYPRRRVSLYQLSSGEKQIIIIFARLIFGIPEGKGGIYIIDEPEASLHLAWQKIFVDSIRGVNKSIQLIFATHAPEIIGRNTARAVKLIKKVNQEKIEKAGLADE